MKSKIVFAVLVGICFGCWDAAVVSWLDVPFSVVHIALAGSVAFTLFSNQYRHGLIVAGVSGLVADLFLPSDGWMMIRFLVAVAFVHVLARYVFTNRSLWGVCFLGSVAVFVDRALLWILQRFPLLTGGMRTVEVHPSIWLEIGWMCVVNAIVFIAIAAFSRRFHPTLSRSDRMERVPWK